MKTSVAQPHKSSIGLDANLTALIILGGMALFSFSLSLSWWTIVFNVLSLAVPIVFFFLEKNSIFVKFQAVQALGIGVVRVVLAFIVQIIQWIITATIYYSVSGYLGATLLLGAISVIVNILITLVSVYVLFKAYGYKQVELPVIGPLAKKFSEKQF